MPAPKPSDSPFRPNLYVVARFLDALARPDAAPTTRAALQAAVGVNYDVFRRYVAFLEAKGYVRVEAIERGSDSVRLTHSGRRVREELSAWIDRFLSQSADGDAAARPAGADDASPAP